MYTITVGNVYSQLSPLLEKAHFKLVEDLSSFLLPNYWRMPAYKAGHWDGRRRLFKRHKQLLPTGYLHRLIDVFNANGIELEVIDERDSPSPGIPEDYVVDWNLRGNWEPRPYQDMAISNGIYSGRGIFNIGTGGGKTGIAAALWQALDFPYGAFFVHTKVLLEQIAREFKLRLPPEIVVGTIGDGLWEPGDITVVLINSLFPPPKTRGKHKVDPIKRQFKTERIVDWLHTLKFFFSDECHLIGNNLWWNILMECENAYYRFAGSGTPFGRGAAEKHMLVAATGPIISSMPYKRLKEEGYVCETSLYLVPFGVEDSPQYEDLSYPDAYQEVIVYNSDRHQLILNLLEKFREGRTALILVSRIAHGENLEAICLNAGLQTIFISGSSDRNERRGALGDLRDSELDVLIASSILDTGLDLPDLSLIINAAGGKVETRTIQKIGRGVRNAPGKKDLVYVDIFDKYNAYLRKHSEHRLVVYKREGGYDLRVLEMEEI